MLKVLIGICLVAIAVIMFVSWLNRKAEKVVSVPSEIQKVAPPEVQPVPPQNLKIDVKG